jgi:hypothetical protein
MNTARFILAVILISAVSASGVDEPRIITLESNRLRVSISPESSGRILSIFDKDSGIEHLQALEEDVDRFSPLVPALISSNQAGVKDWFWGRRTSPRIEFVVTSEGVTDAGSWVEVSGEVNAVKVRRRLTLLTDMPALLVDVILSSEENQTVSYWVHSVMNSKDYLTAGDRTGFVVGDFLSDSGIHQGRSLMKLNQSGVQIVETGFNDYAFGPASNWFGRLTPEGLGGLLLVVDKQFSETEGFFYTWQNSEICSLEAIWPPLELGSERISTLRFALAVVDSSEIASLEAMATKVAGQMTFPESTTNKQRNNQR